MIYVCSDIHGIYNRYIILVNKLKPEDTLYILGDVIDRNPDGIKILKDIMQRENVILLCGNHEDFMYTYLFAQRQISLTKDKTENLFYNEDNNYENIWFAENNGGRVTYEAFLKESDEMQMNIFKFLSTLPMITLIQINDTKFHLSHSGTIISHDFEQYDLSSPVLIKREDLSKNEIFNIIWSSPYRFSEYLPLSDYPKTYICIIGHVPIQKIKNNYMCYKPYKEKNVIVIDGGCAFFSIENKYPNKIKSALNYICLNTMKYYSIN